jgi:hypothetical protein
MADAGELSDPKSRHPDADDHQQAKSKIQPGTNLKSACAGPSVRQKNLCLSALGQHWHQNL